MSKEDDQSGKIHNIQDIGKTPEQQVYEQALHDLRELIKAKATKPTATIKGIPYKTENYHISRAIEPDISFEQSAKEPTREVLEALNAAGIIDPIRTALATLTDMPSAASELNFTTKQASVIVDMQTVDYPQQNAQLAALSLNTGIHRVGIAISTTDSRDAFLSSAIERDPLPAVTERGVEHMLDQRQRRFLIPTRPATLQEIQAFTKIMTIPRLLPK